MKVKNEVEVIEMDGQQWTNLCDVIFADWILRKNKYLMASACNRYFFCREVKQTEKATQFEVTKVRGNLTEQPLYHRWTFWCPKSAYSYQYKWENQ